MSITNKRHDITAITITDPKEIDLPDVGVITLCDPETGSETLVDSSNQAIRKQFNENAIRTFDERSRCFKRINVDSVDIRTDVPYSKVLFSFFRMRERRARR